MKGVPSRTAGSKIPGPNHPGRLAPGQKPAPRPGRKKPALIPVLLLIIILAVIAGMTWWLLRPRGPSTPASTGPVVWPEPDARKATLAERNMVYAGLPRPLASQSEFRVLRRNGYTLGYSEFRRNPLWVAYRIDPNPSFKAGKRPNRFRPDQDTRDPLKHEDYNGTGYDRGHMAPNSIIAREYGELGQIDTFLMSNICPQTPDLNRKVWGRLERLEADDYGVSLAGVWVVNGPVFDSKRAFLDSTERNDIEIPDQFYKMIVDETRSDIRIQSFLVPQDVGGNERPERFFTTVDEIEKRTGLDFFPAISDGRENRIEAEKPSSLW